MADLFGMNNDPQNNNGLQKMQTAYQTMMGTDVTGNPKARPANWFIKSNVKAPKEQPDDPQGKWICTAMLNSGAINRAQYRRVARGHAIAIFLDPAFCYWYLIHGKKLAEKMSEHVDWKDIGYRFYQLIELTYETHGFWATLNLYKEYCALWAGVYAKELPTIPLHRFETRIFTTSWFWKNIFKFVKLQREAI